MLFLWTCFFVLHLAQYRPHPALKDVVRFYYLIRSDQSGEHLLLDNHPQGAFDLIFVVDQGLRIENALTATQISNGILLIGQQQGKFTVKFPARTHLLGIVFEPEVFGRLFPLDLKDLRVSGENVHRELPEEARVLPEQLAACPDVQDQIRLLEAFVFGHMAKLASGEEMVDKVIRYIRTHQGPIRIPDLADEAAMSVRTLQRKLRQRLGVSPKTFSRIIRFNQVLAQLKASGGDWQTAMLQFGFYDQAHLIKDFKQFTGRSPGKFFQADKTLSDFFQGLKDRKD